ncbi:5-adenylylsulfate reductase-like 5 [Quillaja saponaria]|uniref:5-adenylylsulfate reductase-like 5 n=1 Tax=Quillaja saponaria TaxID=32244 RepID=A0AAD7VHY6_QUISA|nr:5-adenylylsulfate reductase-like 5 [Quillaja saponaria]
MSSSSSMAAFVLFLYMVALSSLQSVSSSSSSMCHPDTTLFIFSLQSQCPLSIFPHPPLQVNGNFIEKALTSIKGPGYTSVLFYASWCPFSPSMHSTFETLGSMFPQVEHLAVDQSSALPSVFSRYGIHSVPSILLVNQTSKMRYHGPKNLLSLVQFYRRTAGLEPIQYFREDQQNILCSNEKSILHSLNSSSLTEISKTEPYLVFSISFLCFRVLLTCISRDIISF